MVNSADRGSSAWYIGDPGTHDPTMDAPCEAPAACRDSRIENAHVVPTLHIIAPDRRKNRTDTSARGSALTGFIFFNKNICVEFSPHFG